jgi:pyruvate dehydrogenase (quinone)
MANAMPQAIGAQIAYPGRQVVAMCGDGGLTMLLGDLSTIATYELPIKLVVFDNGLLDMVHWEMMAEGVEPYETDLHNPDFAKLADAYGILGIGVDRHDEVAAAVTKAFEHNGPAILRHTGAVVSTSTKPEVARATRPSIAARAIALGR